MNRSPELKHSVTKVPDLKKLHCFEATSTPGTLHVSFFRDENKQKFVFLDERSSSRPRLLGCIRQQRWHVYYNLLRFHSGLLNLMIYHHKQFLLLLLAHMRVADASAEEAGAEEAGRGRITLDAVVSN
eukprot:g27047.t1